MCLLSYVIHHVYVNKQYRFYQYLCLFNVYCGIMHQTWGVNKQQQQYITYKCGWINSRDSDRLYTLRILTYYSHWWFWQTIHTDDSDWLYTLVILTDYTHWWFWQTIHTGDSDRPYTLVILTDYTHWGFWLTIPIFVSVQCVLWNNAQYIIYKCGWINSRNSDWLYTLGILTDYTHWGFWQTIHTGDSDRPYTLGILTIHTGDSDRPYTLGILTDSFKAIFSETILNLIIIEICI